MILEPRVIVMTVLFAGALAVGWFILPREPERIAMLERDGKMREALTLLEKRFEAGDRNQRTLFQMQQHYETFGELDKSRKMLEMLAEYRPRDPQVQRRLAQFYKNIQDIDAQVLALKRQIDLRYSDGACKELIGIYRQRGQMNEEQAAIQDCRQKGYRRAEDMIRLASLLAVDGDLTQAVSLMRSADDLRRLKAEPERLRLFGALLMLDQPRDAVRRAVRWVRGTRNEAFVDLLVDQLVLAKRSDAALDLVRSVGSAGDAIALTAAELMLNNEQVEAARSYLRGWLERARLSSATLASRFIRVAIDAGDPEIAMRGAQRFGLVRVPQAEIALLVEALTAADKSSEAEIVRSFLRADAVSSPAQPAVRSTVARPPRGGNRGPSGPTVTEAGRELEGWRLSLWTGLMSAPAPAGTEQVAEAILEPSRPRPPVVSKSRITNPVLRRLRASKAAKAVNVKSKAGPAGTGAASPTFWGPQ